MVGIYWYKNLWRVSINTNTYFLTTTKIGFELHHPLFDAFILKQGAQLIHFQPKGEMPLLWSASLSTYEEGKAFRGGIPLCWPWFGKAGSPAHGFARIVEWNLVNHTETKEGVTLVFELCDSPQTRTLWPYAFLVRLETRLGRDVTLSLHVDAQSESTAALHTYFACQNSEEVVIFGLGNNYKDTLNNGISCESQSEILYINQAIDRIYTQPETKTSFQENNRTITISHVNHSDVVVWNPWKKGAEKLTDMQNDDYRQMLCIETARISKPLSTYDHLEVTIAIS